jgi:DNA polymerase-1
MDDFRTQAKKVGWVKTLTGKKRRFPELTYIGRDGNNKDRRKRMNSMMNGVINAPIQGSSGQTCLLAMCSIREEFRKRDFRSRVLSNVHDSILVETYVPELDEVVEILKECMSRKYYENRLGSKVKLKAEIKYGEIWGFGKKHEYWKKNPDEFKQMVERINLRNEKLWTRYPNAA